MNISKILKSPEEFEELKKMLIQDGNVSGVDVIYDEDEEPESYPCLLKAYEDYQETMMIGFSEDEDEEESLNIDDAESVEMLIYSFHFITQKEIRELLEV